MTLKFMTACLKLILFMVVLQSCKGTATNTSINLYQPYSDKPAYAQTIVPEGSTYEWIVNGISVETGTSSTTFLARFDGSLDLANGEEPNSTDSEAFENGRFGQGFTGKAHYATANNLYLEEGTIELWVKFKKPLTDADFTASPYILRHCTECGTVTSSSLMINIKTDVGRVYFTTVKNADWDGSVQLNNGLNGVPIGEWIYLSASYSKSLDRSNFYINGFKVASGGFDFDLAEAPTFEVGNPNVVIDELRISNRYFSNKEIRDNYLRGIPFSANDISYYVDLNEGDRLSLYVDIGAQTLKSQKRVKRPKISLASPQGYVIPNTNQINFQFTTQDPNICAWGRTPDRFNSLTSMDNSPSASHSLTAEVEDRKISQDFYIKCDNGNGDSDDYSFYRRIRVLPEIQNNYPKIAYIYYGSNVTLAEVPSIARYDLIDVSKDNIRNRDIIDLIRETNPDIIMLFYINVFGNTHAYSPVSWPHDDLNDMTLDSYRLKSAQGDYITNLYYPNEEPCNLNVDVGYDDAIVEHVEYDIISRGDWDGIYYDNTESYFWWLQAGPTFVQHPDFDLDGINEDLNDPADLAKAKEIWEEGLDKIMNDTRAAMGEDIIILGNNADLNPQNYNGKMWEQHYEPQYFGNYFDLSSTNSFLFWQANTKEPRLNMNLPIIHMETDYKYHRYNMGISLLAGVYYTQTPTLPDERDIRWYDEFWVDLDTGAPTLDASKGKHYLGEPDGEKFEIETGVWRRDFQNGIVIVNNNSYPVTVNLGGTYRFINGTQDPMANPGGTATEVTLDGIDGRILLNS